jgi:hypothetical protein
MLYNPVFNLPSVPVGTFDGLTAAEGLEQVFHTYFIGVELGRGGCPMRLFLRE